MKILKKKSHWFKIKAKDGRVLSFRINDSQKKILDKIENDIKEKGRCRIIIVKGRQLGISTLIEALLLSYAMTEPAFTGYCMAHDATTANDLFDKIIKFIWQNLNSELKEYYQVKRDNTRQIMFEGYMNSSSVTVGLSARGGTVDGLHISEAGKISTNNNLWNEMITGTFPASEKSKLVVIESTADGGLGKFYDMVQDSLNSKNDFETIFLSWTEAEEYQKDIPESDSNWKIEYADLARKLGLYLDPDKRFGINDQQWYWYFKQAQLLKEEVKVQYPFDIEEAFISKARNKFDINTVKNIQIQTPLQVVDGVKIFRLPDNNQVYSLGIDPSSGLGNDWTSLSLRGYHPIEGKYKLYAQMKLKTSERQTARIAVNLANWYNKTGKVLIIPEVNGLGRAVVNEIMDGYNHDLIYKRYIQDPTKQYDNLIPDYGWSTNTVTRDVMINTFANKFQDNLIEVLSEEEKQEMLDFVWNDEKKRYEAQTGKTDDTLFGDFICVAGFDYIRQYL
jgi:hypothetical protein